MFESIHGMTAVWVVLMIGFLVVEGIAPGLVSIWFALGAQVWLQAVWFIVISVLALVITRPLAKKYVNSRTQATNADMLIGQECIVTETIDKLHGTGAVSVAGKVWTARTDDPERIIEKGSVAVVERIEGVKLIVKTKA